MNLKIWQDTGSYFDYKSNNIFYRRSGKSDEILLCLHGFPSASFDYHKIWNDLTARFSVVAIDLIGYGFSAKPAKFDYTTFQQVDVFKEWTKTLVSG